MKRKEREQNHGPSARYLCFPTQWIGEDGRTLYLVFSGNDNFPVRTGVLTDHPRNVDE